MAGVSQGAGHDFSATVMPVQSRLGNDDAQGVVHDGRTERFPINTTLMFFAFSENYQRVSAS
jgi:hypothetical protein